MNDPLGVIPGLEVIQPVILCGGAGTRLWPLSRENHPKQLLPLIGDASLLQATALRLGGYAGPGRVAAAIVVANEEYRFITAEQFRRANCPLAALILEPEGRNTAPALALAAFRAIEQGDDPLLLVMPADHVIGDEAAFLQAVATATEVAADGTVVTFGIVPDRAETGYGYLKLGGALSDGKGRRLERFVEKPDHETAAAFVASGDYLWNSGIFMLRARRWLAELSKYAPDLHAACKDAYRGASRDGDFLRVDRLAFLACPSDSIDYAVMEPLTVDASASPAAVVPLMAGWSDLGAWDALLAARDKDVSGNTFSGDVLLEDVRNSLVFSSGRVVACVGLEGVVVVETADAVLVAASGRAQEVKRIVARLKQAGRSEVATHRKVYRPWGYFDAIAEGDRFQVKRIVVEPGASLSLQMHYHRAEHWVVVRGTARIVCGEETLLLSENQSTYIPLGQSHSLSNPGKVPLEIIEVQSGSYLGEDDIVRLADPYGR